MLSGEEAEEQKEHIRTLYILPSFYVNLKLKKIYKVKYNHSIFMLPICFTLYKCILLPFISLKQHQISAKYLPYRNWDYVILSLKI